MPRDDGGRLDDREGLPSPAPEAETGRPRRRDLAAAAWVAGPAVASKRVDGGARSHRDSRCTGGVCDTKVQTHRCRPDAKQQTRDSRE